MSKEEIDDKYSRVTDDEIEANMREWDEALSTRRVSCMHGGKCALKDECEVGKTTQSIHLFTGAILPIWGEIEKVLSTKTRRKSRLRIIRIVTDNGQRLVGVRIEPSVS